MAFNKNELTSIQSQLQYTVMYICKYREPRNLGCVSDEQDMQEMTYSRYANWGNLTSC